LSPPPSIITNACPGGATNRSAWPLAKLDIGAVR
jgi:hypothetical protein